MIDIVLSIFACFPADKDLQGVGRVLYCVCGVRQRILILCVHSYELRRVALRMRASGNQIVHVVDDDNDVRNSTIALLKAAGIAASGYASGGEYLESLDSNSACGGCLLLDLHMTSVSGFQMLDILQKRKAGIPIIVFSDRADSFSDDLAHRPGIAAILQKPTAPGELIALVRRILM